MDPEGRRQDRVPLVGAAVCAQGAIGRKHAAPALLERHLDRRFQQGAGGASGARGKGPVSLDNHLREGDAEESIRGLAQA